MLYFSSLLQSPTYKPVADRLFAALYSAGVKCQLIDGARDIWLRDFMPIETRTGQLVSFRYEPSYLAKFPKLRTDFRRDIAPGFGLPVVYSGINLDGGNVVFSPSKETAVISDRIFSENPAIPRKKLVDELEQLLQAEVILIPALKHDMTGHADGMVRFVDEKTALGNDIRCRDGLERRIKHILKEHGIHVIDFPYREARGISAVGSYLNFLETERYIFLPVFGLNRDKEAVSAAHQIFSKTVIPVSIREIARQGGCLNCISWEWDV